MSDKHLYALATFDPDTEARLAELDALLKSAGFFGSQTQGIPHHLTLCRYDPSQEADACRKLAALCEGTSTFPVLLGHIGLFGLRVLFLAPEPNERLLKLVREASTDSLDAADAWAGHATLLIDEDAAILRALPLVAANFSGLQARITGISLYEFFPTRHVADFSFA